MASLCPWHTLLWSTIVAPTPPEGQTSSSPNFEWTIRVNWIEQALKRLNTENAVLVTVLATQGSVPREAGTRMLVFAQGEEGTIGGGHLEFQALAHARQMLAGQTAQVTLRQMLGPSLGQCCGGALELSFEKVDANDLPRLSPQLTPSRTPLALFGGGHVGKALVRCLAPLPFAVRWIDSRDEIFPADVPAGVACEHSSPVQAAVADLAPRSRVLIMSFSHAEDLDIVVACLKRLRDKADLPFVGLIGSQTKWATFRHRLEDRGFSEVEISQITCPIGVQGISGKEPEVIAVAVAAQLLQSL
ncbi:xanthine dehydrogenase accessory protein XdhC [Limnohabitans sp. 2KL-17]|nr:xanthine dehydrogenase accessory protein XdhC [Limnohabitans sp. 2KL-17]